ncbi:ABC transporter substrate-binding protein [Flavobacterium akiainvivens]|uniref:ABC transporter substrate-binding protein n=1 Tax=Flavobacterium akiainvivens TaxID=1202724 RepID=A0A0M9VIR6_9FLAO|nr:ABC transporter substrate-binding protein [Flavobacterium akiainvivens]KOS06950.1 ABC transporter substrate-binding protein [Flavobacterium akiainvivens]SFQ60151.1 iron complex transport system substrate-binding protein [Flavobacterium akiainvivens]
MKKITSLLAAILVLATVSCKNEGAKPAEGETTAKDTIVKNDVSRIVSLNGAVTEVIAALGHEKNIVGVDVTSTYPESVKTTAKDLGHVAHGVSIEGIMELKPTIIFGTEKDLTPDLTAKIKASGVKAVIFKQEFTKDGAKKLIADVAKELGHEDIKAVQDKIDTDLAGVTKPEKAPKVLFIYARGANMLMVSGSGTPIEAMIQLAGGENAITGFADYKPLTPEAVVTANPDYILLFDSGAQSVNGEAGVLKLPGVDKTNAGKNKKIITMDGGLLTNFGPRTGEAAKALNALLK